MWNHLSCMTARFWCYTPYCICCLAKSTVVLGCTLHATQVNNYWNEKYRNLQKCATHVLLRKNKSITFDQNKTSRSKPELSTYSHMLLTVVVVCKQSDAQMGVLLLHAHWCFCITLAAERGRKQTLLFLRKCWLATVWVQLMWFLLLDLLLSGGDSKRKLCPHAGMLFFFF